MIEKKYEKLIKDYEQHARRVEQATTVNINETVGEKKKRIKKLEKEYIDWFEYYFPHYAKSKCATFHKKMSDIIVNNEDVSFLGEIYRSGAKSVHLDLGIPLFLYVKKQLNFMLLVGETAEKAKKLISDIQITLNHNHRFINDYGRKFKYGDWADGNFTTSDGVKFMSLGFGQSPRGVRELSERPDYIVVDDIDSKKRCNNDKLSRKAVEWVWEDLQGTFDEGAKRRRFVVANNNFHKNTVINQLKEEFKLINKKRKTSGRKKTHFVLTVTAVKDFENFEPAWPEKTSSEYWRNKYEKTPYRSFMREYMHTHIQDGVIFKNEQIQYKNRLKYSQYDGLVIYGDLSYKNKGDYKALIFLGKHQREFHILKIFVRQTSRANCAIWLYDLYEDDNLSTYNIRYEIEGLFAQDEFVNDFDIEGDSRGYHIPVVADTDTKINKFDRIESMAGYFERGNVWINSMIKDSVDAQNLIDQLTAFEKGSGANDDAPDALQSALVKLNKITFNSKFKTRTTSRKEVIGKKTNRY